jgi:hypothetical protein
VRTRKSGSLVLIEDEQSLNGAHACSPRIVACCPCGEPRREVQVVGVGRAHVKRERDDAVWGTRPLLAAVASPPTPLSTFHLTVARASRNHHGQRGRYSNLPGGPEAGQGSVRRLHALSCRW